MIDPDAVREAAGLLAEARRSGRLVGTLPPSARPETTADAHAVQDATIAMLGEKVVGWKVGIAPDGDVMRGAIFATALLASPARIAAASVPLLGIEAEIAFRFERALPMREKAYTVDEVAEAVTALVGIEIVDSRFTSYRDTPLLHRTADCMSNGGFVTGTVRADWRAFDLAGLRAVLRVNGHIVAEKTGGHPMGDPILPAVALVNAARVAGAVTQGQIVTTGAHTGLHFAEAGDEISVEFEGFGSAALTLDG